MRRGDLRRIEVMDTTLRDGEQTPDVSYTPAEKLQLARLLLADVGVDRIEIGQARVSAGELEAVRRVAAWARRARMLPRVEILGYCDGRQSVDWIVAAGGKVLNLLTKGSERHCRMQLRMEPAEHRASAEQTLAHARRRRLLVNAYLEDWSSGVRDSFDYVFAMVETLGRGGVRRVFLADTLGILGPDDVTRYRAMAVAAAGATRFGKGEAGFSARRSLVLRPNPPRFLRTGDSFQLPVLVQNLTDGPLAADVAAEGSNVAWTGPAALRVAVPAGDRVEVRRTLVRRRPCP